MYYIAPKDEHSYTSRTEKTCSNIYYSYPEFANPNKYGSKSYRRRSFSELTFHKGQLRDSKRDSLSDHGYFQKKTENKFVSIVKYGSNIEKFNRPEYIFSHFENNTDVVIYLSYYIIVGDGYVTAIITHVAPGEIANIPYDGSVRQFACEESVEAEEAVCKFWQINPCDGLWFNTYDSKYKGVIKTRHEDGLSTFSLTNA